MKQRLVKGLLFGLVLMLPLPGFAGSADQAVLQPDQIVRQTVTGVLEQLKKNKAQYEADHDKLFAMVDERILPYFDFRKMSQLVLGLNWRRATDEQREKFVSEFKQLLVRTYAIALLKYTNQTLEYLPYTGQPTDKVVSVKVNVDMGGGSPPVPVYTQFYNGKNGWKVIDISIEGISLVTNYRNVYNDTIKTDGLDKLIQSIADSNRKATQGTKSQG
jgi:phospholipid transport system substrate-binding protein